MTKIITFEEALTNTIRHEGSESQSMSTMKFQIITLIIHMSNLAVATVFTGGLAFLEKEPPKFEC